MQMNHQHFQYNTALEAEMDPCVKVTAEFNACPAIFMQEYGMAAQKGMCNSLTETCNANQLAEALYHHHGIFFTFIGMKNPCH